MLSGPKAPLGNNRYGPEPRVEGVPSKVCHRHVGGMYPTRVGRNASSVEQDLSGRDVKRSIPSKPHLCFGILWFCYRFRRFFLFLTKAHRQPYCLVRDM